MWITADNSTQGSRHYLANGNFKKVFSLQTNSIVNFLQLSDDQREDTILDRLPPSAFFLPGN